MQYDVAQRGYKMTEKKAKKKSPVVSEFKRAVSHMQSEYKRMKQLIAQEEMLLPPSQAAAMIGISPQSMERRIREGTVRSFVCLGKTWVSGKQIDEMMNERIKNLVQAGVDKNKIEQGIYDKMYLNAKAMKGRSGKPKDTH